jgi:hypothetical protein
MDGLNTETKPEDPKSAVLRIFGFATFDPH